MTWDHVNDGLSLSDCGRYSVSLAATEEHKWEARYHSHTSGVTFLGYRPFRLQAKKLCLEHSKENPVALSEKDQLRHNADCLSSEQCATLNKIADALFGAAEELPGEPVLTCHFCQVGAKRSDAAELGWVPSFWINTDDRLTEIDLPVCRPCACQRLQYRANSDTYDLKR